MISEAKFRAKLPFRGRGLADLAIRVGDVTAEIDRRLGRGDAVRVLDLGCGYGSVLLELRERYGAAVELHGLNLRPNDGDSTILRRNAIERGLIAADSPADLPLPRIHHADVADGLPFADASFDVVVSQVAWLYFGNKVTVLREVSRILRDDGIARIDVDEIQPLLPPEYARLVEIWRQGRLIPFGDYLQDYGAAIEPAAEGEYLKMGKLAHFADDLELAWQTDVGELHEHWNGIKCVYRVRG